MSGLRHPVDATHTRLAKCPTGIAGRDDVTHGGLPADRP